MTTFNVRSIFIFSALLAAITTELPTEPVNYQQAGFYFSFVPLAPEDFPDTDFKSVEFAALDGELRDAVVKCENRFIEVNGSKYVVVVREDQN